MKKLRILFQGDSVTDGGRDKRNYYNMGNGYPKYASKLIADAHPEIEFEFINLGISGNRTSQLFDRLHPDALALQPDIVSILIGVNDVWHRQSVVPVLTSDEQIELNYRMILTNIRKHTNAKIMMIAPYLIEREDKAQVRAELDHVITSIIRPLADEFADVYVPLNEYMDEAEKTQSEPKHYSADGVHPNQNGAEFIGKLYAEAIEKLL